MSNAYRPIEGRCLPLLVYDRSSKIGVKIAQNDQSTVGPFSVYNRCLPANTGKKLFQMPKCRPTDDRSKKKKKSADGRTMIKG